jgi:hypothetical protein
MKKTFSRREVLGIGAAAGAVLLGTCCKVISSETKTEPTAKPTYPWEYKELDVKKTQARAYESYFQGGCMFGVFEAIAAQVAEMLGRPYTDFPFAMSSYGGGGVALWGTLCGTCNGAAMAISMFHTGKLRSQLISEVFTWYEATALPVFLPKEPKKVVKDFKMKPSQAKSTLCHVSITRWTNASGFQPFTPQRVERCARVVANMAGFTAELLNKTALKKFTPKHQVGAVANGCLECHAKGKQEPNEPEVVSKMYCTTCHPKPHEK